MPIEARSILFNVNHCIESKDSAASSKISLTMIWTFSLGKNLKYGVTEGVLNMDDPPDPGNSYDNTLIYAINKIMPHIISKGSAIG